MVASAPACRSEMIVATIASMSSQTSVTQPRLTRICTQCDNACDMGREHKAEFKRERRALAELLHQRERLATEIARQQTRVAALAALCDKSEEVENMTEMDLGGLTNACRTTFRAAGNRGLMPTEVRNALEQLRFPTRTHKNILASIHTVIRRLEQAGEIRKAIHDKYNGEDKSVYQWAGPNYGASNSLANQMADAERDRLRRKT
jgi:hypothetical protein